MPKFDGTGPIGLGPRSGRGRGKCGILSMMCDARRPPGRVFLSLAAIVAGVVVKDAMNPRGIIRKVLSTLGSRFADRLQMPESDEKRIIRTIEAEVFPGPQESK